MHNEPWQLYDEQGRPLKGQAGYKEEVLTKGILHGAAHVWIWRKSGSSVEILLQKRAASKRTWPNCYDVSAAGHIDLGEEPIVAAVRETQEEIGVTVSDSDLSLITVYRARIVAQEDGIIDNEFQWVYIYELPANTNLAIDEVEVSALDWETLDQFIINTRDDDSKRYVPHGKHYFDTVVSAIQRKVRIPN